MVWNYPRNILEIKLLCCGGGSVFPLHSLYATGPKPLDVFLKAMPLRLILGVVFVACVWWAGVVRSPGDDHFPWYFYAGILLVYALHQVVNACWYLVRSYLC